MRQTTHFQKAVMTGRLTDNVNLEKWILSQPDVLPRVNDRLFNEPTSYLNLQDVNRKFFFKLN